MANLKTDDPLSRRIARSFLQFLNSVEPSDGVDGEALDVAKECLADVFKIHPSSNLIDTNNDSLIDIFTSRVVNGAVSDHPSLGNNDDVSTPASGHDDKGQNRTTEQHSPGKDELFGQFLGALEKIHYFRRMPDGNDDPVQLDRATNLFHNAVEEMQKAGAPTFDQKILAETFKSKGNKAVQSKLYAEAIELYTLAIALCGDNAVYHCNRAAAYTQIHRYAEAVKDCLKSIEINPNYSKAYSRLGFAYYAQGKYRDAIDKGFMKALQLDPNNDSVKENIRVAEQKLREEQQRGGPGQSSTSTSNGYQFAGGSSYNVDGLSVNISTMLRDMTGGIIHPENRSNGESETGSHNEPEVMHVNGMPEELSGALRSMMGMFSGGGGASHGNQQDGSNGRPSAS